MSTYSKWVRSAQEYHTIAHPPPRFITDIQVLLHLDKIFKKMHFDLTVCKV